MQQRHEPSAGPAPSVSIDPPALTGPAPFGSADQAVRMMLYDAGKKSTGLTYVLWFFLGSLAVHRFYLGRVGSGVVLLMITVSSVVTFGGSLLVTGVWLLVDMFLIPGMVRSQNQTLIRKLS